MKIAEYNALNGVEIAHRISNWSRYSEGNLRSFKFSDLGKLDRAFALCGWDIPPGEWTKRQLQEAIRSGRVPRWNEGQCPVYPGHSRHAMLEIDRNPDPREIYR